MYQHNIARFNYTTYDVHQDQDIINPRMTQIGQVLGIYHVNVIYIGVGMVNYTPLQMEFLWVRWYKPMDQVSTWETVTLDRVRFLPMMDEYSLDFLDPADVLRACHIILSFAKGKRHPEGSGVLACAGDNDDWHEYFH
ncbi:hypothetical protein BDR07DRAFT_1452428 [Suillus spraguei]|nr:hypothetical protein BDR07DRAFT_1452428 [Suillus spraguei]